MSFYLGLKMINYLSTQLENDKEEVVTRNGKKAKRTRTTCFITLYLSHRGARQGRVGSVVLQNTDAIRLDVEAKLKL